MRDRRAELQWVARLSAPLRRRRRHNHGRIARSLAGSSGAACRRCGAFTSLPSSHQARGRRLCVREGPVRVGAGRRKPSPTCPGAARLQLAQRASASNVAARSGRVRPSSLIPPPAARRHRRRKAPSRPAALRPTRLSSAARPTAAHSGARLTQLRKLEAKAGAAEAAAAAMPGQLSAIKTAAAANPKAAAEGLTGAHVLVANLVAQGVRRVYVLPGAKIDRILGGWAGWVGGQGCGR